MVLIGAFSSLLIEMIMPLSCIPADVLDLSGDTAGDIEFRTYRNTSLADLTIMVAETCVNSCTAAAYFSVKFFGQFEQHVEAFTATPYRNHRLQR